MNLISHIDSIRFEGFVVSWFNSYLTLTGFQINKCSDCFFYNGQNYFFKLNSEKGKTAQNKLISCAVNIYDENNSLVVNVPFDKETSALDFLDFNNYFIKY